MNVRNGNYLSPDRQEELAKLISEGHTISTIRIMGGFDHSTIKRYAHLNNLTVKRGRTSNGRSKEERIEAVKLSESTSVSEAARVYGVSRNTLHQWRWEVKKLLGGYTVPVAGNPVESPITNEAKEPAGMYKVGSKLFSSKDDAIRHCVELAGGITLVMETKVEV